MMVVAASAAVVPSLPSRGAWIEIVEGSLHLLGHLSLPSRGAWIEMVDGAKLWFSCNRRSPRGERG